MLIKLHITGHPVASRSGRQPAAAGRGPGPAGTIFFRFRQFPRQALFLLPPCRQRRPRYVTTPCITHAEFLVNRRRVCLVAPPPPCLPFLLLYTTERDNRSHTIHIHSIQYLIGMQSGEKSRAHARREPAQPPVALYYSSTSSRHQAQISAFGCGAAALCYCTVYYFIAKWPRVTAQIELFVEYSPNGRKPGARGRTSSACGGNALRGVPGRENPP